MKKADMTHPAECPDCRYYRGWHYCSYHKGMMTRLEKKAREEEKK